MKTKHIIAIFVVFILMVFGVVFLYPMFKRTTEKKQPIIHSSPNQSQWRKISPGMNYDDFVSFNYEPSSVNVINGEGTVSFAGINKYWDTVVSIKQNKVSFIKEHVFLPQNTSFKSRLSAFQELPIKLIGEFSESGQYVYLFSKSGVALLANPDNDTVYEVWYFPSGSLEEVLATDAFSGLDTNPNKISGGR